MREGVPDLLEEGLGDLVLVAVDLPAAHAAYLVLGPQEVVVRQAPVVVQVCSILFESDSVTFDI